MSVDAFWSILAAVWFLGWTGYAIHLFRKRQFRLNLTALRLDALCILLLLAFFAPLYLVSLYEIPWEVNTDEAAMMWAYRQAVLDAVPNIFGLGAYWGFPNLLYLGYGHLAELLGGINILHSRQVHAATGLAALAIVYALISVLGGSRLFACVGTYLVGINHSFIMVSRMALRNHSAIITESASLTLLIKGWLDECPFLTFAGGVIAGLAWYAYYPARITIVLWMAFMVLGTVFRFLPIKKAFKLGTIALAGWLVLVVPHAVAMQFDADRLKAHFEFQRDVSMLTAEGRETAAKRQNTRTPEEGVIANIKEGLSAFNSFTPDRSGIYYNPGFGFLDPITGIMLWLGVLLALVNGRRFQFAFALFYFGTLWLMYTFILTKAPDYTRMAILLPFIGWFSAMGLFAGGRMIARLQHVSSPPLASRLRITTFAVALSAVTAINLAYAYVFVVRSFNEVYNLEQRGCGETARFIESRPERGRHFYLISDYGHMYYTWGQPEYWYAWCAAFVPHGRDMAPKNQSITVIPASRFSPDIFKKPLTTVFMSKDTWHQLSHRLSGTNGERNLLPDLTVYQLSKDGHLLAVEN